MRACVHKKAYYSFQGDLYSDQWYANVSIGNMGGRNAAMQHLRREHLAMQTPAYTSAVPPNLIDWDGFAADAMSKMLPSLDSGNSLLNSLFELRDFKRLLKSVDQAYKGVIHNVMTRREAGKWVFEEAWGLHPWLSKPQKVSSAYLSWKFAWAPFVREVSNLIETVLSFQKKVKELRRRENQRQQRYWGKTLAAVYTGDGWTRGATTFSGPGDCRSSTIRYRRPGETYRVTAVMRYKYKLPPEVHKAAGQLAGFLDTLGVNANPAIIWNAIPFSFVVDWFYDVGDFLERFTVKNVRPITEITDFSVSVKAKRVLVSDTTMRILYDAAQQADRVISTVGESTYYERRLVTPSLWSFNDTPTGISGTQRALSGALIAVNLPSGKGTRRSYDHNWLWQ